MSLCWAEQCAIYPLLFFLTVEKTEGSLILKEIAQIERRKRGKTVGGQGEAGRDDSVLHNPFIAR